MTITAILLNLTILNTPATCHAKTTQPTVLHASMDACMQDCIANFEPGFELKACISKCQMNK